MLVGKQLTEDEFRVVESDCALSKALVDLNSYKKVLVIDKSGRLIGTLTDGDVRRWLIKGGDMNAICEKVCNKSPHTAKSYLEAHSDNKIFDLEYVVHIDNAYRPIGIFSSKTSPQLPENTVCILMAGGKGKRLRPLTLDTPKPLIEVGGKPMIDFILNKLAREGVKIAYLSVCYMKEKFIEYIGDGSRYGLDVRYIVEESPLGTAGSIKNCLNDLPANSHLLVANGDVMLNSHFSLFSDYHLSQNADATVVSKIHEITNPYGVLEVRDGVIKNIVEKPVHKSYVSAGIYYFNAKVLIEAFENISDYIDMPELIVSLCTSGKRVACYPIHEEWHDLGTVAQLKDFENNMATYDNL